MSLWPPQVVLEGRHARLTPLTSEHAPALAEAVKDGQLWKLWYTGVAAPRGHGGGYRPSPRTARGRFLPAFHGD